jgi:hypothetical protein
MWVRAPVLSVEWIGLAAEQFPTCPQAAQSPVDQIRIIFAKCEESIFTEFEFTSLALWQNANVTTDPPISSTGTAPRLSESREMVTHIVHVRDAPDATGRLGQRS